MPTGRGGTQDREWYRGIPVPPNATTNFSRRDNTNYMQTGVLSGLQLTAMFPNVVVENFYIKTRNAIEEGKTKAPFGFVIPVQRDMTRAAALVNILRAQGIEVGQATSSTTIGDVIVAPGAYVIKRDQPYGRLAKNLLEKQVFPDPRLTTYDDSGWTMGFAMNVDVKPTADKTALAAATNARRLMKDGVSSITFPPYSQNKYRLLAARNGLCVSGTYQEWRSWTAWTRLSICWVRSFGVTLTVSAGNAAASFACLTTRVRYSMNLSLRKSRLVILPMSKPWQSIQLL